MFFDTLHWIWCRIMAFFKCNLWEIEKIELTSSVKTLYNRRAMEGGLFFMPKNKRLFNKI